MKLPQFDVYVFVITSNLFQLQWLHRSHLKIITKRCWQRLEAILWGFLSSSNNHNPLTSCTILYSTIIEIIYNSRHFCHKLPSWGFFLVAGTVELPKPSSHPIFTTCARQDSYRSPKYSEVSLMYFTSEPSSVVALNRSSFAIP